MTTFSSVEGALKTGAFAAHLWKPGIFQIFGGTLIRVEIYPKEVSILVTF